MKPTVWSNEDYETGLDYLANHEREAQSSSILETRFGVEILLPIGLPARGLTLHGIFMAAPILMFAFVLIGFLTVGVIENWGINTITLLLASLCIVLLWGLNKVLKLLLSNRELFPRRHFVTLGEMGIAMHFARFQIPIGNPRTAIPWEDVRQVQKGKPCFFPPAWLRGITTAETVEVYGREGRVVIPFHLQKEQSITHVNIIKRTIKTKMAN